MRKCYYILAAALGLFLGLEASAQQATITERKATFGTYPFSDPNPVPNPTAGYYPYFHFDGYSADKIDQEWNIVELENPYIKVTLFPEIGGKVWGATDKATGKDFIYFNHVVKFRNIGIRGAWVAGGLDFNFGIIGHAPTCATPIDFYTKKKDDGSVSCYIASYELMTRTYWTVEVNLPADKAYFTTTTTWHNDAGIDEPYYQWMCSAYKVAQDQEFNYPGDHYIGHSGDLHTFPYDNEGRDLSWYKNNSFGSSKSDHVLGYYGDFYGTYYHDEDFGSVHVCPYYEKRGMKLYLWSQSRDGGIWRDLLTDDDPQYLELQAGKMYNQPAVNSMKTTFKHPAFQPLATDHFTEYWFPAKNTKGMVKASTLGTLNIIKENGKATLYFSPVQDATVPVVVTADGKEIYNKTVSFKTLQPWSCEISDASIKAQDNRTDDPTMGNRPKSKINGARLKVVMGDDALVYSEYIEDNKLNRPKEIPSDFDWNSVYGLYTSGEQWLNQKYYANAERDLKAAIEKDKYFAPALIRLASLYYRWGRYDEALTLLNTALSLNAYDGEANYFYALCNARLGNNTDAKDGFSLAAQDVEFSSAAYAGLSGMYLKDKNWNEAVTCAKKSLITNTKNYTALQDLMVAYRHMGKKEEAKKIQSDILEELPLQHFARYEQAVSKGTLLADNSQARQEFVSLVKNELHDETYMEMAVWYESVGCYDEAIDILKLANNPMALYKRAWLLSQQGKESEAEDLVKQADGMSIDFVFPFRHENFTALEWAADKSDSWKPDYLLALLYHRNGNKDKAYSLIKDIDNVDYYPFYMYRASFEKGDSYLSDLRKAESIEKNWRTGRSLINYYEGQHDYKKACDIASEYHKLFPTNQHITLKYCTELSNIGQNHKALGILKKAQVLPNEGATAGREVYRKVNILDAINYLSKGNGKKAVESVELAKIWPENLGVGKPADEYIDYRLENYIEAQALMKSDPQKAKNLLNLVASVPTSTKKNLFNSGSLLSVMAMKQLGDTEKADEIVAGWDETYSNNPIMKWCKAIYEGDLQKAKTLLPSSNEDSNAEKAIWDRAATDSNFELVSELFSKYNVK